MVDAFYNAMHAIGYTHPVHATQVHMPIGLVMGAFILGLISFMLYRWTRLQAISPFGSSTYARAARLCILLALLFWFTTVAGGALDWQHYFAGAMLFAFKIKMGMAGFLFIILCIAIFLGYRNGAVVSKGLMGIYTAALLAVVTLGYFGGVVAYGERVFPAPEAFQAGQQVFSNHCVGCHPGGANNIQPERGICGSVMLASPVTFNAWIRNAPPPMPAFSKSAISDAQLKELYQYLNNALGK